MGELVTTVTKFKSKTGSENKLIEDSEVLITPVLNLGRYLA